MMKHKPPRPYRIIIAHESVRLRAWSIMFGICAMIDGLIRTVSFGEVSMGLMTWASREMMISHIKHKLRQEGRTA